MAAGGQVCLQTKRLKWILGALFYKGLRVVGECQEQVGVTVLCSVFLI